MDLDFYIDIHAHSTLTNGWSSVDGCVWCVCVCVDEFTSIVGFMYGNVYDEEDRFERQAIFPKLLAQYAEDFSWVSSFHKVDLGRRSLRVSVFRTRPALTRML